MAGGDLAVTLVPNNFAPAINPSSIGGITDTGAAQDEDTITIEIGGVAGDGNVVDVYDSNDGTNFEFLHRAFGGDPSTTIPDIARYLRTVRQKGTAAIVVQWGKTTPSGGSSTVDWLVGGNPTGPLTGGALDGSGTQVGGLSAGDAMVVDSGTGATTTIKAGHTAFLTVSIAAGAALASAEGVFIGAGVAAPAPIAGTFLLNALNGSVIETNGVAQWSAGVGGVQISGGVIAAMSQGVTISAGTAGPANVGNVEIDAPTKIILNSGAALQWPTADGVGGAPSMMVTDGAGHLSFVQIQRGTSSIGAAGVSAAIAANITATSRILITLKDAVGSTATDYAATAAGRTPGTPGSFTVTAFAAATGSGTPVAGASGTTFDWEVIG